MAASNTTSKSQQKEGEKKQWRRRQQQQPSPAKRRRDLWEDEGEKNEAMAERNASIRVFGARVLGMGRLKPSPRSLQWRRNRKGRRNGPGIAHPAKIQQ